MVTVSPIKGDLGLGVAGGEGEGTGNYSTHENAREMDEGLGSDAVGRGGGEGGVPQLTMLCRGRDRSPRRSSSCRIEDDPLPKG